MNSIAITTGRSSVCFLSIVIMDLPLVEAVFVPPAMSNDRATTRRSSGITTIMSFDVITTDRSSASTISNELRYIYQ